MDRMSQLCERARAWASLRADGELSELESALLDGHLGRCADCRSFAAGAARVAAALRAAELERPAPLAVRSVTHARARGAAVVRTLQVAAAAAVVVAVGFAAAASAPRTQAKAAKPVAMVAGIDSPDRLRELRRPGLVERPRSLPRNRYVPGIAV
jgi:Putative zinc-finger